MLEGRSTKTNTVLWIVQGLLAAMFLLAGVPKLIMSADQLTAPGPIQVPIFFVRFIGICEILGAIGMILPGLTGTRTGLTPLAASGLVIIMIGATTINAVNGPRPFAMLTAILGLMAAFVVYGRWSTTRTAR